MAEEQLFYRFRTLDAIFKYGELENQEIYFASPEELNDPMEGFKNIIFQGDNILWHNLIRHYIMCLVHMIFKYKIVYRSEFDEYSFTDEDIYIDPVNIPNIAFKNLFNDVYYKFRKYFNILINNFFTEQDKFLFIEFKYYLLRINIIVYNFIDKYLSDNKIDSNISNIIAQTLTELNGYKNKYKNIDNKNKQDIITQNYNKVYIQLQHNLISQKDYYNIFIYTTFIEQYCNKIIYHAFPKEYVACFNKNFNNTIMWSHYANKHTGICLIFNSNSDCTFNVQYNKAYIDKINDISKEKTLNQELYNYIQKHLSDCQNLRFYKIQYNSHIKEKNFFLNLYLVDKDLNKMWYYDEITGKESLFYKTELEYKKNTKYNYFEQHNLIKTPEWEYEQEYRLILDIIFPFKKDQIVKYDFSYLDGIIFGIRTPLKEKSKIIDIIKQKCKKENRSNFNFYQAYYNITTQTIEKYRLDYLDKI